MNNRREIVKWILVFAFVAAIVLVWGKILLKPGDEMGYSILGFYIALPIVSLISSYKIARTSDTIKWGIPLLYGVVGYLIPYAVFGTMDSIALVFCFIPASLGLLIGNIIIKRHGGK